MARTRAPIRGYDAWKVGDVARRLGRRTAGELASLLAYERATKDRKGAVDAIERALTRLAGKAPVRTPARVVAGTFDRARFLERCSEFLEHERSGVRLYELGLQRVDDEDRRDHIEQFLDETRGHVRLLTSLIRELGGDPDERSESAELDREKTEALIETGDVDGDAGLLSYFESLMIAEFVDHANWALLEKLSSVIDDDEVKVLLEGRVAQVQDEEAQHYRWAMKQVEDLSLRSMFAAGGTAGGSTGAGEDEREAA